MTSIDDVYAFWFDGVEMKPGEPSKWFRSDPEFDAEIREKFGDAVEEAKEGEHDDWAQTARGSVALVVMLDQFTRNIYRKTPAAFSGDAKALKIAREALARGFDQDLSVPERAFLYMPLEHAEDRQCQEDSIAAFEQLVEDAPPEHKSMAESFLKFARWHKKPIDQFGRYPHRNKILGRESTPEEEAFLKQPNSSF